MYLMTSDSYSQYTRNMAEADWQKRERLDYCEHPLTERHDHIGQAWARLIAMMRGRRLSIN